MNKRPILLLILFILLFLITEISGLREFMTLENIQNIFQKNIILSSLIFIAIFLLGNLAYIPGFVFLAAAVLSLGKINGGILTYISAVICCNFIFYFIDYFSGDALKKIDKPIVQKLLSRMDRNPILNVFILRVMFQTAPAINYSIGFTGVPFRYHFIGTILGLPFPILFYILAFDQIFGYFGL